MLNSKLSREKYLGIERTLKQAPTRLLCKKLVRLKQSEGRFETGCYECQFANIRDCVERPLVLSTDGSHLDFNAHKLTGPLTMK